MASVAFLQRPHAVAQRQRLAAAAAFYHELCDFGDDAGDPAAPALGLEPTEGRVAPYAGALFADPFAARRTCHDVVPRAALLEEDPASPYRDGAARDAAVIARALRSRFAAAGLLERIERPGTSLHEHFGMPGNEETRVNVVNIVHTSYFTLHPTAGVADADADNVDAGTAEAPEAAASPAHAGRKAASKPTIFAHRWFWRRLLHLGTQKNHVHRSVKICYIPPTKATHLVFQTGRVLETGASNERVADIMFHHATTAYFKAAGAHGLRVAARATQNIVSTSCMPQRQGLCLDLLSWRNDTIVEYRSVFAGATITHPTMRKVAFLVFPSGPIVCVGPNSIANTRQAFEFAYALLRLNTNTPENVRIERTIRARPQPARTATSKKRQRDADSARPPTARGQRRMRHARVLGTCVAS